MYVLYNYYMRYVNRWLDSARLGPINELRLFQV